MGKNLELEQFKVNEEWKKTGGAAIVVAHPDDEILIAWGVIHELVKAGIPVTVIAMTFGELGKLADNPSATKKEKRITRESEFQKSNRALGIRGKILGFPDTEVGRHEYEAEETVVKRLRLGKYGVVITFDDRDRTYGFYHGDHKKTSEIVANAAGYTDVEGYRNLSIKISPRPELYLWTTIAHDQFASHRVIFSQDDLEERKDHAQKYYSSQFPAAQRDNWGVIFDRNARSANGKNPSQEMFWKVR